MCAEFRDKLSVMFPTWPEEPWRRYPRRGWAGQPSEAIRGPMRSWWDAVRNNGGFQRTRENDDHEKAEQEAKGAKGAKRGKGEKGAKGAKGAAKGAKKAAAAQWMCS